MKKILKGKYTYVLSKNNEPALYCESGDTIEVHTLDCYSNQIKKEEDLLTADFSVCNPATGPIYVNGSKKGDVLKVEILDIEVGKRGLIKTVKGCGALWKTSTARIKFFDVIDDKVKFNDLELEINPMIGVIGTASDEIDMLTGHSYELGGNMDSNVIVKGSIVYLPVRVDGGLLSMGDLHALMGDGEIAGTGIEIEGKITVKVSVIKDFELNYPVTETNDAWFVNTYGESATQAIQRGYVELQRLVSKAFNWDNTDATLYLSIAGIINSNQACLTFDKYEDPYNGPTFRVGVPKIKGKELIK